MDKLNVVVENSLKRHTGLLIDELNLKISQTLENRLNNSIFSSLIFKKAKKEFQRSYFMDLLMLSLGNIKKASHIANLNRRHIYRICQILDVDFEKIRLNMLKPKEYIKQDVSELIEKKVNEFALKSENNLNIIYSNLNEISNEIALAIDEKFESYHKALQSFEKHYFKELLKQSGYDVDTASEISGLSSRHLIRKLKLNNEEMT